MKSILLRLVYLPLVFLFSCGLLGAGSHVYCEPTLLNCPSDTILAKLQLLKASGRYDDARSFPDSKGQENNEHYSFYFYDRTHNFLVRLEVPLHTPKNTEIHLAGIKDFNVNSEWRGFNQNVTEEKKKEVLIWFDSTIRPVLVCDRPSENL